MENEIEQQAKTAWIKLWGADRIATIEDQVMWDMFLVGFKKAAELYTYTEQALKDAWDAGENRGYDSCLANQDGMPEKTPDWQEWLSEYKKNS